MNITEKIAQLPNDIIILIKEFIPHQKLVFVNLNYYNLYHTTIRNFIPLYENYIRDMIRRDNEFVFEKILNENFDKWIMNRQYIYKNMVFNNYIYFIMYFCIENDSEKCRLILYNYLKKRDLWKNIHKKNITKYIKWSN